ncbi:FAD/NAD(P)-binding domain-containing protein [Amniculicola lignicola CBS 123094]|uniref:FAD/NAD(P)-binding domain-containing protein n=1 Tax=Amniculicola lignicola CBS 123094 TaxID=1392246 RepID=A0A6A5X2L4_9PLEO|nr:FAD/NAD(P)-binding domain-containing protein [Amniculicola lignicola CBS 123094]
MEHRTYIPNNRCTSDPDTMTRMERDLSSSSHQESYLEPNGDGPMIRRTPGRVPHVCVVGAGIAGLRCADILLQNGVKVTILEGRDRVGGRLCQSSALGHAVDLGPNWIHGTHSNPILDLARETNTTTMTWDGRQSVFDHLGNAMPPKEAAENSDLVWTIIEQAMKHSNENSASIPSEQSLLHYFEEKVKTCFPSFIEGDEHVARKRETILYMASMWGAFVGSEIQKQSLKFFWLEECIDGENLFVAETYRKVLDKIVEPVQKGADIMFGRKVVSLVSPEADDSQDPRVVVKLDGREDMIFDEVVMTAPLGWLKRNKEAFLPELPNRLKQAIDDIGYGHLDKVYITFPAAFWNESLPSNHDASAFPHPQHDPAPNVPATTAPIHQSSSVVSKPTHHPGFTHWNSPHYAASTNPHKWNQECVNLAALPDDTAHPTLLFYTFGQTSIHLASLLKEFPTPEHPDAKALLIEFFEPYFSRLPNYDPKNADHQPKALLATVWANDELAGYGSYANFQVGLERGDQDVEVMRRGLPERGVWLAGEHTAPFVALGTVTGAWWAGEGVAKRICKAWGLKSEGSANGNPVSGGGDVDANTQD